MIAQLSSMLVGLWLMMSPSLLSYGGPAARIDYVIGPLIAAFGCVACWEVTRSVRWLNVLAGGSLLFSLGAAGSPWLAALNHGSSGLLCVFLSLRGSEIESRVGGGWAAILNPPR